ncbi:MAG: diguanylate cyclase [Clostridia bacterium]|nr:diguanylate cyclase [Clostridia bacterium]
MYLSLILREELVCLAILIFLFMTSYSYRKGKEGRKFHGILTAAITHVVFDGLTAWTVNRPDAVPAPVNDALHAVFYLSAVFFTREMLLYTAEMFHHPHEKQWRVGTLILMGLYAAAMILIPMEYGTFGGTRAGTGINANIAFVLGGCFVLLGFGLIVLNRGRMERKAWYGMTVLLTVLLVVAAVEYLDRSALLTGGAATIVTAGFFFFLENPAIAMERKAHTDAMTGVENRNAYERDMAAYDVQYQRDPEQRFIFLFADMNNLKSVNGMFGHGAGDEYIIFVAELLRKNLPEAEHVYRMGGDEFLAIYRNVPEEKVLAEIEKIHALCEEEAGKRAYPPMLAMGYAISGPQYRSLHDVLRVADYMMYQNKTELKREMTSSSLGKRGTSLNLTGLMDRMFDAMCLTDDRFYPYMTNLETGVTRVAPGMAEAFGLDGEFFDNFLDVWSGRVHPEDAAEVREDVTETMKGNRNRHDMVYRVKDRTGHYIPVTCRGAVYRGKDGDPDLFSGYIAIRAPEIAAEPGA